MKTTRGQVRVDEGTWRQCAGRAPFVVEHDLVGDPRLQRDAIVRLAGRLPAHDVETSTGAMPKVFDSDEVVPPDRPVAEIAAEVESLQRWMALHDIEQVPEYADLVRDALRSTGPEVVSYGGGMRGEEGYIFLSAPGSVTPAHLDHEHNFLLQVEGTKTVTIGFIDQERESRILEHMYSGGYGRSDVLPEAEPIVLEPGMGVYIPPRAVHMLEVGDATSLSLSLVWHTPELDRAALVYRTNAKLRKARLQPRPPGASHLRDVVKAMIGRAYLAAKRAR